MPAPLYRPPDWCLPPGVTPGLWDYVHNDDLARGYGAYLADSPLPVIDNAFLVRHLRNPGRVLDLGCGTGRSLIPLAQRGFEAVGVDLSEGMLKEALVNARRTRVTLQLIRANMVELDALRPDSFDYCLCLFGTLGMIAGAVHRQRLLEQVRRVLRPGGLFLVHVHNRYFEVWTAAGRRRLFGDFLSAVRGRPAGERILPPHQGVTNLYMHLFSAREIRCCLNAAELAIIEEQPVSLCPGGHLAAPWCLGGLRALGYLLATRNVKRQ